MASDLLTTAELREHLETGLSDAALERLVDSADAYLIRMKGQHDPDATMTYETERSLPFRLWLPRTASDITSVEERQTYLGAGWQTREEGYYRLADQGQSVLSLGRRFYPLLRVEFTPVPENDIRAEMLIGLVRLELQDTGLDSERDDTYTYKAKNKTMARREIMERLSRPPGHGGLA